MFLHNEGGAYPAVREALLRGGGDDTGIPSGSAVLWVLVYTLFTQYTLITRYILITRYTLFTQYTLWAELWLSLSTILDPLQRIRPQPRLFRHQFVLA